MELRATAERPSGGTGVRLGIASAIFVSATVFALGQYLEPYSWHEPYPVFSVQWFVRPLEQNIDAALPEVNRGLHAVAESKNGKCAWIAGADAFLAYSADQGRTWNPLTYEKETGNLHANASTTDFPCSGPPSRVAGGISLVPSVQAAAVQVEKKQAPQGTAQEKADAKGSPAKEAEQGARPAGQSPPTSPSKAAGDNTPPLNIELSASAMDFGEVDLGRQLSRPLYIKNHSDVAISISDPQFIFLSGSLAGQKSSPFSVAGLCKRVDPSGECSIVVSYTPREPGETEWLMRFSFTDGLSKDVALTGESKPTLPDNSPSGLTSTATAATSAVRQTVGQPAPPAPTAPAPGPAKSDWPPTMPPDFRVFVFLTDQTDQDSATLLASDGTSYHSLDAGRTWNGAPGTTRPESESFASPKQGQTWSISDLSGFPNKVLRKTDTGTTVQLALPQEQFDRASGLYSIYFKPNSTEGWVAGASRRQAGLLLRTLDGEHWAPATRETASVFRGSGNSPEAVADGLYRRFLPPWYLLALFVCGWVVVPTLREKKKLQTLPDPDSDEVNSIGNHPVSDKPLEPGEPDALELGKIATGLSFFLSNRQTTPPLVIGVNGRWGSGKSSLMNLLKKNLESQGASPVWFNAWHHQTEEQLLAALLQAVKEQAVPPVLVWSGIVFRVRLVWNRLRRHWQYVSLAVVAMLLLHQSEHYLKQQVPPISIWGLITSIFQIAEVGRNAPFDEPLTALTGLIAAYGVLSKLLTAFGSNPAALLTTVSGTSRKKDLEAQTSFRQRFASEFSDVTRAMTPRRRMLILIDDLDRCRPEKVREVLEGVNFLVSSGECFVVLGMARDIVEHYMGLSFRPVVDGMSWEALGLTQEEIERAKGELLPSVPLKPDGEADPDIFARSRAFARLYLDKLIQIEVNIPEPTPQQKEALSEIEAENSRKDRKNLAAFQAATAALRDGLQAAAIISVLVVAAVYAGVKLEPPVTAFVKLVSDNGQKEKVARTENAVIVQGGLNEIANSLKQAAANKGDAGREQSRGGSAQTNQRIPRVETNTNPPAVVAGGEPVQPPRLSLQSGRLGTWPFGLAVLLAGGIALILLLRVPQQDVSDKPAFTEALKIWHPLVMTVGAKNTPRTGKRFQNRVRYLAMRQRAAEMKESESAVIRFIRERLHVKENPPKAEENIPIPERLLVAFAAIEVYEPAWIHDEALFKKIADGELPPESPEYGPVLKAQQDSNWMAVRGNLAQYRQAYLKLCSELSQTAKDKKGKSTAAMKVK